MKVVCAWCGKDLGSKAPYEDKSITHTICAECKKKYFPNLAMTVKIGSAKVHQILAAGEKQLSPEEFDELESLIIDFEIYGLTAWINAELGKLMAKIEWELELEPSQEWAEALQACDYAFLGNELKAMCYEIGASPIGHKKRLCARLYKRKVPEIVAVMDPYIEKLTPERIKEEIERYAQVERLPQTEPLYASKLRKVKDRLEKLHRTAPDEFYRRKRLIEQAIEERERGKGKVKTMPELTLDELRELLKFTDRLYR